MELSRRIAAGCAIIIIFAGAMVAVQIAAQEWADSSLPPSAVPVYAVLPVHTIVKEDFRYGPQSWRPYSTRLNISQDTGKGENDWYLTFIRLNASPYGGNPYLGRRGAVAVNYSFAHLAGTAAFHVIGLEKTAGASKTNRQDGYGASSFSVTGTAGPGSAMPPTEPLPAANNIRIVPAGIVVDEENEPYVTYFISFNPLGGGVDSLHITDDLTLKKGDISTTVRQQGRFYVTHTGGKQIDELLLLLAVNESQPDDFSLSIESHFVPET